MKILGHLIELQKDVSKLQRGCDCEYDHRCSNCNRVLDAKSTLKALTPEERIADLATVEALEEILPASTTTTELVNQLRTLINLKDPS